MEQQWGVNLSELLFRSLLRELMESNLKGISLYTQTMMLYEDAKGTNFGG